LPLSLRPLPLCGGVTEIFNDDQEICRA